MKNQVQISVDSDVYDLLKLLMVPPISDANAVIKALLFFEGHDSRSAIDLRASEKHFSMEQELDRARQGIYDSGGAA